MAAPPKHRRARQRPALTRWSLLQILAVLALTIAATAWIAHPHRGGGGTVTGGDIQGTATPAPGLASSPAPDTRAGATAAAAPAGPSAAGTTSAATAAASATTTAPARRGTPATSPPGSGSATAAGASRGKAEARSVPPSAIHRSTPAATRKPTPKPGPSAVTLTLTPDDRTKCPPTSRACVDLSRHLTWLQSGGAVTYGPVRMMPGVGENATPRGDFEVEYKDRHHVSNIYFDKMPFSVFFATGGIAFHEGSLVRSSHGCVHLTQRSANHFFDALAPGDRVVVF